MFKKIFLLFKSLSFILKHDLNKKNKIKALIKYLNWHLLNIINNKPIIFNWINDSVFIARKSDTSATGNIYVGLLEYIDMLFVLHALKKDDVFIDVGANQGMYTIISSKVIGAKTYAFEPVENTYSKLQQNISINNIDKLVTSKKIGISNSAGKLLISNNLDAMNQIIIDKSDINKEEIITSTLDNEINENEDIILKIDVEGFEMHVLKGATKLFSSNNLIALIIEINNSCLKFGNTKEEIHNEIIKYGFYPVEYNPFSRSLSKTNSIEHKKNNTIYIRDFKKIKERILCAKKSTIHTSWGIEV